MTLHPRKYSFQDLLRAFSQQSGEGKLLLAFRLSEFDRLVRTAEGLLDYEQEGDKTAEDTIIVKLLWFEESKIEKHFIDAAFVYQNKEPCGRDHRVSEVITSSVVLPPVFSLGS